MSNKDISVAIQYPGSRVNRITYPLSKTSIRYEISPDNPFDYDFILLDCPGINAIKPIMRGKLSDTKIIYRVQGDILRAFQEMNYTNFKYRSAKRVFSHLDGAISIESVLARRFTNVTGVENVALAGLAKSEKYWPTVKHTDEKLRLISVTNVNYIGKIQPMIDYAPAIDMFLERNGGYWHIYGKGKLSGYLQDNLENYDNIMYCGYNDEIKERYARANCMLHLSNFDSLPNAILEGFASNLPVITNMFSVFSNYDGPILTTEYKMIDAVLSAMQDPSTRSKRGKKGRRYLNSHHTPEIIGRQYRQAFEILA